jgi:hypothetical protein
MIVGAVSANLGCAVRLFAQSASHVGSGQAASFVRLSRVTVHGDAPGHPPQLQVTTTRHPMALTPEKCGSKLR